MHLPFAILSRPERTASDLERACRAERRRALAGHWTYDLGYHTELVRKLEAARKREETKP